MRGLLRGTLYCGLWYGSVMAGFLFIACPMLPLLFFSPPLFRKCNDLLFSCWELYSTALLKVFGVKILVSGDHISPTESAILVMNHRTRVDWNFLWAAMYQACLPSIATHRLKFVLKDPIRHIPGPEHTSHETILEILKNYCITGWIMQMNGFLYITRRWEEDQSRLSRTLDYLVALDRRSQLLIFPEGTDLTKNSKEKSDRYALQHKLPQYSFTLHPKTTGFSYLVQHLQQANYVDAVYDLTIAYPDYVPQSELDLIKGKLPNEVHFHIKRIPSANMPRHDSTLRRWLEKRWFDKEEVLKQFYDKKSFSADIWPLTKQFPLQVALYFWSILTGAAVLLLIVSPLFQLWTFVLSSFFVALSFFSTGFNQVETGWYWCWKTHFLKQKRS
ncbi:lysocardiolipin acyltransferase 1-like isoform X1 [Hylaeus volcanicus]|uniref:lysocardiolipin acyltransferase 1-like isoform X1 n=1 Tax=Hylaeus volcanicus TaxID=313075 RepID=UPI0023B87CD6|nr:lysocardiolipin acyltransferase 1-like isoform X1 [Hylaeus volcanicus]